MNKFRKSLFFQINFLFASSLIIIILLWIFFVFQETKKEHKNDMGRFFKIARTVHSMQERGIDNGIISSAMDVEVVKNEPPQDRVVLEKVCKHDMGLEVYSHGGEKYLIIHSPMGDIHLRDIKKSEKFYTIHLSFSILIILQLLIYLRIKSVLNPINNIHKKLISLEKGDLSMLVNESRYVEISQFITAYNNAIGRIKTILNIREMFNKVFMHEIKMPIAKGMFYVKKEPSIQTNTKIGDILKEINRQLDEFSRLESGILNEETKANVNNLGELLQKSIVGFNETQIANIVLDKIDASWIGNGDLWIVCFRNIIENALKYATDGKIDIKYANDVLEFANQGEPLPLNPNTMMLDGAKKHKSSSGFGFGLFIIKTIIEIEKYKFLYTYDNGCVKLSISKSNFS